MITSLINPTAVSSSLVDFAPFGIGMIDERLQFVYFNKVLADITGFGPGECSGVPVTEVLPDLAKTIEPIVRSVLSSGQASSLDLSQSSSLTTEERHFFCCYYPVCNSAGDIMGVGCWMVDITDRRNALLESEERLRTTIDAMQDGLILRGVDGVIMFNNDSTARILGNRRYSALKTPEVIADLELIREDGSLLPPEEYPFNVCIETGLPQQNAVVGFLVEGKEQRWISISSSPLFRDGAQKPYAVATTLRDITDRQKYEQEQAERRSADEMQRLSNRLISVQEHERRKIAADLHDEIGGALTGLKLLLEMTKKVDHSMVPPRIDQATSIVQDMIAEVRQMSMDLRPTILDHQGLIPALDWYFKRFTNQTGIKISFRLYRFAGRLRPESEVTLYRVIQEALTNIARYAQVDRAVVSITKSKDIVKVSVRDHGAGFDPKQALERSDSSGLAGMRERLRVVGGTFKLATAPGKGTRLTAELPIAGDKEPDK